MKKPGGQRGVRPSTLYYGVSILLIAVAVLTEVFHVDAAVVLVMFSLLSAMYGMELQRGAASNARRVTLWLVALFITALVFYPVLRA